MEPRNSSLESQNMKKNEVRRFGIDSGTLKEDWHMLELTQFQSKLALLERQNYIFRISTQASLISI